MNKYRTGNPFRENAAIISRAVLNRWTGFWAEDAKRVDAMQARREEIRAALGTTLAFPAPGIGAGQRDLRPAAPTLP
jgi:O-acetyl-ADP-ribose deacetylase (regulator of RNase III)